MKNILMVFFIFENLSLAGMLALTRIFHKRISGLLKYAYREISG